MSKSSLWVMDSKFNGIELIEFGNSWLLSPIIFNTLFYKYLPSESYYESGEKKNYITSCMFDRDLHRSLNNELNESNNQLDRVAWELSNEQIFFTKDKEIVSYAIRNFLKENSNFLETLGENIYSRFYDVADEILKLDINEFPYFIFKNTNVDDNVQRWFVKYDGEFEDYLRVSLKENKKIVSEFVIITDGMIEGFKNNLDFFNKNNL